ncbi:AAA family ATPase [Jiella sp. M17.18]|uniref:AAA family ATPase n=1 Tax=Jiella sp. M17.18 TaxID=3234247 RepID=UPI0034DE9FFD
MTETRHEPISPAEDGSAPASKSKRNGDRNPISLLPRDGPGREPFDDVDDVGEIIEADAGQDANEWLEYEIALRLKKTKASGFAVFSHVRPALPSTIIERLKNREKLLVIVRAPSPGWRSAAQSGVRRALEDAVRSDWILALDSLLMVPDANFRTWERKSTSEKAVYVVEALAEAATIVCFGPTEKVPPQIEALADHEVDLATLPSSALDQALERRFGAGRHGWPSDLKPGRLDPTLIDVAIERGPDTATVIASLRRMITTASSSGPHLEELHGYGPVKEWGMRMVQSLDDHRAGRIPWSEVDGGALLVGPPGTGKTLFASALARSADVAFFPTSYAAWQSTGDGHLGTVMKEMRRVFAEAAAAPPALIFIDEIDTLQARGSTTRHDDWWRSIINGLLECLDGTGRREGVVVLAACNDGSNLDPAVVRSGRLDRRFFVGLPSEDGLARILQHHLPNLTEADVQPVAMMLAGSASGADAVRISRDARQAARIAGRAVTAADLLAVAMPPDGRPEAVRRRVAIHEAGHAVALMSLGIIPTVLSIAETFGGRVHHQREANEGLLDDFSAQLVVHLAGRAAEEVILGTPSCGAGGLDVSDLGRATTLLAQIEGSFGLGSRLSMSSEVDGAVIEARLRRAYAEAMLLMLRHAPAVRALADTALRERIIGQSGLSRFWAKHRPPDRAKQAASSRTPSR